MATMSVSSIVRRSSRWLLFFGVVLVAAPLIVFACSTRYFYNFFAGPFNITPEELAALSPAQAESREQNFVRFRPAAPPLPGISQEWGRRKSGRYIKAVYYAVPAANRLVLVRMDPDERLGPEIVGELAAASSDQVQVHLPAAAARAAPPGVLPSGIVVDCVAYSVRGYVSLALGIPSLLLGGWWLATAQSRLSRREAHPFVKKLAAYGDPEVLADDLDEQLADTTARAKVCDGLLLPGWVVKPSLMGPKAVPLAHIASVAVDSVRTKYGRSYFVAIKDTQGRKITLSGKQSACEEAVAMILAAKEAAERAGL